MKYENLFEEKIFKILSTDSVKKLINARDFTRKTYCVVEIAKRKNSSVSDITLKQLHDDIRLGKIKYSFRTKDLKDRFLGSKFEKSDSIYLNIYDNPNGIDKIQIIDFYGLRDGLAYKL